MLMHEKTARPRGEGDAQFRAIHDTPPTVLATYPDGAYSWNRSNQYNPLALLREQGWVKDRWITTSLNTLANYAMENGLKFGAQFEADNKDNRQLEFQPTYTLFDPFVNPTTVAHEQRPHATRSTGGTTTSTSTRSSPASTSARSARTCFTCWSATSSGRRRSTATARSGRARTTTTCSSPATATRRSSSRAAARARRVSSGSSRASTTAGTTGTSPSSTSATTARRGSGRTASTAPSRRRRSRGACRTSRCSATTSAPSTT